MASRILFTSIFKNYYLTLSESNIFLNCMWTYSILKQTTKFVAKAIAMKIILQKNIQFSVP